MDIDLQLFKNIMAESRHNSDLLDSFSPNQFKSKERIIKHIRDQLILRTDSEIVILGGWYGSILIPAFKEVKRITLIDKDKKVISIANNRLFNHYKNVDFITSDVFHNDRKGRIQNADLIINTSCEHMRPMSEWGPKGPRSLYKDSPFGEPVTRKVPWWTRVKKGAHFAFQSNDMFNIDTHINCVNNSRNSLEQN